MLKILAPNALEDLVYDGKCYMVKSVYYGKGAKKNSVLDICK